jgi:hypothetical protein
MRLDNVSPLTLANDNMMINDFGYQPTPTYYPPIYDSSSELNEPVPIVTSGSSQVLEPEILVALNLQTPTTNTGGVKSPPKPEITLEGTVLTSETNNSTTQNNNSTTQNNNSQPSATTGETKTYVGGGTTPDSNIIVNKPKPNYLMFGLIGVVGVYVIYKIFFNKKGE